MTLKEKIFSKGYTLETLSKRLNMNPRFLDPYTSGKRSLLDMQYRTFNGLCEALDCTPKDLLQLTTSKRNKLIFEHNGETKTLREWSDVFGVNYKAAYQRYSLKKKKNGFVSFEQIFPEVYRK